MGGNLWKIKMLFSRLHPNGYGDMFETGSGNYISQVMDLQNVRMSDGDETNGTNLVNTDAPQEYWNYSRYGTLAGLLEVMK